MRRGVGSGTRANAALHLAARSFFFNKKATTDAAAKPASDGSDAQPAKSLNLKDMQAFMKASPQQQLETMQKALEMQKTLSKVPGLGVLARKNAAMMERVIQMQQQAASGAPVDPVEKKKMEDEMKGMLSQRGVDVDQAAAALKQQPQSQASHPPPPPPPRKHAGAANSGAGGGGPSLDELRRVNLGSEIEALFQELRSLRESKNSYRDKYNAREKECESLQQEARTLRDTEANIRSKLQLAEKNVVLLNSENMTLRDGAKRTKELDSQVAKLTSKLTSLQTNDTEPLLLRIQALEGELRAKEEHHRSLVRKLERTRRRDPLLQFSQVCSTEPMLLCAPSHNRADSTTASAVEEAFGRLRDAYDAEQKQRWCTAATTGAHAAKVMVAAATEVLLSRLGTEAKFDVVLLLEGPDANAPTNRLLEALRAHGFLVEKDTAAVGTSGKWHVVAQPDAPTPTGLGPYGYACALVLADGHRAPSSGTTSTVAIASATPFISKHLTVNALRCAVQYESCRSGGPGGQAANVTETQITAKLFVDHAFVMQAEAQDSRSAVANKEAATDRLQTQARKKWNDRATAFDAARMQSDVAAHAAQGAGGVVSPTYGDEYLGFVADAAQQQQQQGGGAVSAADAAVVYAVESLRAHCK